MPSNLGREMTIRPADIGRLTVPISAIAATVAMHGGSTFQTNMFSTVKTAFDVAVIRLLSIPGSPSGKKLGGRPGKRREISRPKTPGTPTNLKTTDQHGTHHRQITAGHS